jgi:hypothetical protein
MARKEPVKEVLRALFARSGNQCAFPGCTASLISENNKFIGQICHIESANPGGERYNEDQSDEDRRAYENLLVMCYPHHIETNDEKIYTVEKMKNYKLEHESNFQSSSFKINEELLYKLSFEMEEYWSEIELLNTVKHAFSELAIPIDSKGSFFDVIKEAHSLVEDIEEVDKYFEESDHLLVSDLVSFLNKLEYDTTKVEEVKYYNNPFVNRNWEMRNLRLRNDFEMLKIVLLQLAIKYLEEYLKTNGGDFVSRDRLNELKETFKEVAQNAMLAD